MAILILLNNGSMNGCLIECEYEINASHKGGQTQKERGMAMTTDITYGTPVNLELSGAYVDLGVEQRDGQLVIRLVVDDDDGATNLALSPEQAGLLADVLKGLAEIRTCG